MHILRLTIAAKSILLTLAFFLVSTGLTGCTRTVLVTKQMTWECAPDEFNAGYSAKPSEYVRFRFVENPRCFVVETSKNFCAEFTTAGRSVVSVDFEITGRKQTVKGYKILAVDGRPILNVGGWGHSGANGYEGPSPIAEAFRSH
jgi:hypothetical protein